MIAGMTVFPVKSTRAAHLGGPNLPRPAYARKFPVFNDERGVFDGRTSIADYKARALK